MKLTIPPLDIKKDEGFTEKDILQRKKIGEELMNLVVRTDDKLVVALDAPWGEGKTTFIKMWQGLLQQNGIPNIYFDAFENDYQKDAFLAIASEIYALIEDQDTDKKQEFIQKLTGLAKTIFGASIRIGVKSVTAGLLNETIFENLKLDKDIEKEASDIVDGYIRQKLESAKQDKQNFQAFKEILSEVAKNLGQEEKPLIFIIDELDRCKPPFALELLENIKHLYSIPDIVFVLVMNRQQLEESVKCEYGSGIQASKYLQKFINIWVSLANVANSRSEFQIVDRFLHHCLSSMQFPVHSNSNEQRFILDIYKKLAPLYKMSLRDVERALTNYAIIMNTVNHSSGELNYSFVIVALYVSIIKVMFPNVYQDLSNARLDYEQLASQTMLDKQDMECRLNWEIKYSMLPEQEVIKFLEESKKYHGNSSGLHSRRINWVEDICEILNTFNFRK